MEEIELHDWKINEKMTNKERYNKSISAYYLNEWFDLVKDITFDTVIYPLFDGDRSIDSMYLDKLPFEKCMVRYEHKSPKDSENWTFCTNYDQIKLIFSSSLTAKSNPGKYLCIRKWEENILHEFRCFYNRQLVAVADHSSSANQILHKDRSISNKIIDYIESISDRIPYIRCVLDICILNNGEFKLIEFNSWETNAGALPFDWIDDTDILYPNFKIKYIPVNFRSADQSIKFIVNTENKFIDNIDNIDNIDKIKTLASNMIILNSKFPSNWLKTEKYLYVTSDIWLAIFDLEYMTIKYWKRGVYRFSSLYETNGGLIVIEEYINKEHSNYQLYNPDMSKYRGSNKFDKLDIKPKIDICESIYEYNLNYKYGFICKCDDKLYFCRFNVDSDDYTYQIIEFNL
jgi:hypothetical protein